MVWKYLVSETMKGARGAVDQEFVQLAAQGIIVVVTSTVVFVGTRLKTN